MKNATTIFPRRGGFTLIELMIVILILTILIVITVQAFNITNESGAADGARAVQSYLEGARNRAVFRDRTVGVRLMLDPNGVKNASNNPVTVSSMMYVGSPRPLKGIIPQIRYKRQSPPGSGNYIDDKRTIVKPPPEWQFVQINRGLLDPSIAMRITLKGNEREEEVTMVFDTSLPAWVLTREYAGPNYTNIPYEMELLPAPLPNQQPRDLPPGVVVELDSSRINNKIPNFWYVDPDSPPNPLNGNETYRPYLDILFTPRGVGHGAAMGQGLIHLHVCQAQDVERVPSTGTPLGNPRNNGLERLVTVNPTTGNISVSEVPQFVDANQDDAPDGAFDPYVYAELGVRAQ